MKKSIISLSFLFVFSFFSIIFAAEAPQFSVLNTPLHAPGRQETSTDEITRISEIKATVSRVTGTVTVRSRGSLFWHDARPGDFLRIGDEISTKENGKIEFKLENGNSVKLKPGSHLVISKMTQNKLTGEYENFLESDIGKLMAKIEKLKGKSEFKIKTPTAIAGARGTTIYLDITPLSTLVLFTDGPGFFTNTISGDTFDNIPPNNGSQSDSSGNISEPGALSEGQMQNFTGGWDFGLGAEGYTPPADTPRVDVNPPSIPVLPPTLDRPLEPPPGLPIIPPPAPLFVPPPIDTDDDGIPDSIDTDDDNDTIPDTDEPSLGTNPLLTDTDSDGIPDNAEPNTDNEGLIDDYDTDDDNDGLADIVENIYDLNPLNNDTDGDGLTDGFEALLHMDPTNPDTDGDGMSDADEIRNGLNERGEHSDGDGVPDTEEIAEGTNPRLEHDFPHGITYDQDLDREPNQKDWDADGDHFNNAMEARYRFRYDEEEEDYFLDPEGDITLNPLSADTDGGGLSDFMEAQKGTNPFDADDDDPAGYYEMQDSDEDGLSDSWEEKLGLDPDDEDTDGDGLTDMEELSIGTDPNAPDTDGDGLEDGEEADRESDWRANPLLADSDEDGATDKEEIDSGTDPDHPLYFPEYVERQGEGGIERIYLDTDRDGVPNSWDSDDDGDGIADEMEAGLNFGTNPLLKDSDGDGVDDGIEIAEGTNPLDSSSFNINRLPGSDKYIKDTDGDGISDQLEREAFADRLNTDTDGDGLNDGPEDADSDGDGLSDGIEIAFQLDAFNEDTDGDGLEDGWEAFNDLDPFTPDMDNDGLTDKQELTLGTNPDEWDTDKDGVRDGLEVAPWWVASNPSDNDSDDDGLDDYKDAFPTDYEIQENRDEMRQKRLDMIEENQLRREIRDMLSDFSARYNDSVMERIADAQTGKVLTDAHGYRVRVEQYVFRPNVNTVEVMNITLRTQEASQGLSGLHTLDWKTSFNNSLDSLTGGQIRGLPWDKYLDSYGLGFTSPQTPGDVYPESMSIELNHNGEFIREETTFSQRDTSARQEILSKTFSYNIAGNYGGGIDIKNQAGPNKIIRSLSNPHPDSPRGFEYYIDEGQHIYAYPYVITDSAGLSTSNYSTKKFDTLGDMLLASYFPTGNRNIGENNLEIMVTSAQEFDENHIPANPSIDLIYIPWNRQHWRDNHSWRGGQIGAEYSRWRRGEGGY